MKPTRNCEGCKEFFVDVAGDEIRCMAGFRPRFYMPKYSATTIPLRVTNKWGFKRRCNNFIEQPDEDTIETKKDLVTIGYHYYKDELNKR